MNRQVKNILDFIDDETRKIGQDSRHAIKGLDSMIESHGMAYQIESIRNMTEEQRINYVFPTSAKPSSHHQE